MNRHLRLTTATATLAGFALLATACASAPGVPAADDTSDAATRAATAEGRIAVAYDGGIVVLEAESLDELAEFASEEFVRLNSFGDGRTISVTTSEGFRMLDTAAPALTDLVFEADAAGHVVAHAGTTVLFDDGTGVSTFVATDAFDDGYEAPSNTTYVAAEAHHGVSVRLEGGTLVTTRPDRSGAVALHAHQDHWDMHASSDQCPGIHGEGTAADEAVIFGCENGALLYHGEEFVKFTAPDEYGRMGNAYVLETSPLVVGDYKNDPDAEGYLLNAVTIIDTAGQTYEVVDLPDDVEYTWRGVARGPGDLAYILSTDGQIHVFDPETGELSDAYPVIGAWEGPAEWQNPHPAITVSGDIAYVTEPAANSVHAVNLTTGEVVTSVELHHTPNEIAVATE